MSCIEYENLIVRAGNREACLVAKVFAPEATAEGDHKCQVEIFGIKSGGNSTIYGADSMQAMGLSIRFVNTMILTSEEFQQGCIFVSAPNSKPELVDKEYFLNADPFPNSFL